jgi:hypothetical protein
MYSIRVIQQLELMMTYGYGNTLMGILLHASIEAFHIKCRMGRNYIIDLRYCRMYTSQLSGNPSWYCITNIVHQGLIPYGQVGKQWSIII